MPLTSGTRLGAYEIISTLGAGGMGEVYRARDARLDRQVAIKVLPDAVVDDPDRLARFEREAKVLAALNHPLIAHVYGFEQIGDRRAIVMELVEGFTLEERLAQGPLAIPDALRIARQLAEALETAHDLGIIHRDLKPANIKLMVRGNQPPRAKDGRLDRGLPPIDVDDCTVKVLDFGLAKALDTAAGVSGDALHSPTITARATELGTILGTAAYMSPEQARGKAVDRRADVWAFGVVCYEMLTGSRLFKGEDISDTMAAVLRQPIDLAALPPGTPTPSGRFSNAASNATRASGCATSARRGWRSNESGQTPRPPLPRPEPRQPSRRGPRGRSCRGSCWASPWPPLRWRSGPCLDHGRGPRSRGCRHPSRES